MEKNEMEKVQIGRWCTTDTEDMLNPRELRLQVQALKMSPFRLEPFKDASSTSFDIKVQNAYLRFSLKNKGHKQIINNSPKIMHNKH